MVNLEFLIQNPDLAKNIKIEVTAKDLIEFARSIKPDIVQPIIAPEERYLTPQQYAEALQISLVTLWSWDKKGITKPIYLGNKKRYRFSDIEKLGNE